MEIIAYYTNPDKSDWYKLIVNYGGAHHVIVVKNVYGLQKMLTETHVPKYDSLAVLEKLYTTLKA